MNNLAFLVTLPTQWWIYLVVPLVLVALIIGLHARAKNSKQIPENGAIEVKPSTTQLPTQVASAFLDVSLETKELDIRKALTHSLSLFLMADLCGLLEKSDQTNQFTISQMFDLIREDHLSSYKIPLTSDLVATHAIEDGLPVIGNGEKANKAFKQAFQTATGYNAAGNLMIIPLASELQAPAIVCLTPYTQREFLDQDLERLLPLKGKLIQVLSKASNLEERANAAETLRLSLKQLTRNHSHIQEQLIRSQRILEATNIKLSEQKAESTEEVALWVERQQTLESEVDALTERIAKSLADVYEAKEIRRQRDALEKALQENKRNLTELNATLANAQGVIKRVITGPESGNQAPVQSLNESSFITNSSDYINNAATQSLTAQLDDSIQRTASEFVTHEIKLSAQIEQLDASFEPLSSLTLQIIRLMQVNAYKASPNHATVEISVSMQQDEIGQPSLELLVTDQGGGLSIEEQSHFLRFARSSHHPAPAGIGDAQALREAVALVNQAGGHLWIHSAKDQLTTYRVLLPVKIQLVEKSRLEK
ncbi:MAG: ATP-binding protein [Anaerolineaceae bacterium]